MKIVSMDEHAGGDREWAVQHLRNLADQMERGEVTDVIYASREPDRTIKFGIATVNGLIGLEGAGMAAWLMHWIQNTAEFEE